MVTIIDHELESMKICDGCPYMWVRVQCTGMSGDENHVDREFKLVCTHIDACKRAVDKTAEHD